MATTSPPVKFSHQDLSRQAFRGQSLQGATFDHCNLRGGNFQGADLQGARFIACHMGYSLRRWAIAAGLMVGVGGLQLYAVSMMVLGGLGVLPGAAAWPYIVVLKVVLAIATASAAFYTTRFSRSRPIGSLIGLANGALGGFFYSGIVTDENPLAAICGAVLFGMGGAWMAYRFHGRHLPRALGLTAGAIAAYGFAFSLWTTASSYLTVGLWGWGIPWAVLSLISVGITLRCTVKAIASARDAAGTSFCRANLTGCRFIETDLRQCSFEGAIAFEPGQRG